MSFLPSDFSQNVFVNCPFDDDYVPMLRPLLFSVIYFGYNPRIASERFDSGEQRVQKICQLIQESKFSIHDISRMRSRKKNDVHRMNMPFELGLDIGCKLFKSGEAQNKICLIIEREKYEYHRALSDLSGVDIKEHDNNPEKLVRQIRNWFVNNSLVSGAPSGTVIWERFNEFMADFYRKRQDEGFRDEDLQMMPVREYMDFVKEWLRNNMTA